jgi:hypothetical protein
LVRVQVAAVLRRSAKTHRLRATGDPDVKTHRWVLQQTSFLWNWKTRLASGDFCRQDFSLVYLLTKPRRSRSRPGGVNSASFTK